METSRHRRQDLLHRSLFLQRNQPLWKECACEHRPSVTGTTIQSSEARLSLTRRTLCFSRQGTCQPWLPTLDHPFQDPSTSFARGWILPIEGVCSDMMGLTKLDWNSSTFYTRMPVTIGVSKKVGKVMVEMVASKGDPPSSYKFFM